MESGGTYPFALEYRQRQEAISVIDAEMAQKFRAKPVKSQMRTTRVVRKMPAKYPQPAIIQQLRCGDLRNRKNKKAQPRKKGTTTAVKLPK